MANRVILNGRLGKDLELIYPDGKDQAVVNMDIATAVRWTEKGSGDKKTKTTWHKCEAWGKKAENYAAYMKKGHKYYLEGHLETRKVTIGETNIQTSVVVIDDVEF